jgi:hypothetical protein
MKYDDVNTGFNWLGVGTVLFDVNTMLILATTRRAKRPIL